MKPELKHLAPYLPYSLKVIMEGKKCNIAWMSTKYISVIRPTKTGEIKRIKWEYAPLNLKPILRPIRDIADNILIKGGWVCPMEVIDLHEPNEFTDFAYFNDEQWHNFNWSYQEAVKLFEWHFDVFGLIDAGLAIDINTLKQE